MIVCETFRFILSKIVTPLLWHEITFFFYLEDINCLYFLIYRSLLIYSTLYSKITGSEKVETEKLEHPAVSGGARSLQLSDPQLSLT